METLTLFEIHHEESTQRAANEHTRWHTLDIQQNKLAHARKAGGLRRRLFGECDWCYYRGAY